MTSSQENAISQIAHGLVALADPVGAEPAIVAKLLREALDGDQATHAAMAQAIGKVAKCRITHLSVSCGIAPDAGGQVVRMRQSNEPTGSGGGRCIIFLGCTVCYEYECSIE